MKFRKLFKFTFRIIVSIILLIIIYFIAAITLSVIPVNSDFVQDKEDSIAIYIKTNGVHVDIVLPLKNEHKDWSTTVNPLDTKSGSKRAKYIAFGWGDKGFYINTPTWADLKFTTAFNALFYLSSSAMHVTFYEKPNESKTCKKIVISKKSYEKIVHFVESGFDTDNFGNYKLIKNVSYWNNDSFYDAKGSYGLFYTCNTWTNKALKAGDLKACLWTPFDKGIFYQYNS